MTRRSAITIGASLPFVKFASGFQAKAERASPHETASIDLSGKSVTISYGRPYLKGRKVGDRVAPFGKVWRLGADEATKLTVPVKMTIGSGLALEAGSYALFAIPGEEKWTMIVNKVADQWGAFDYDQSKDLGRFDVPVVKLSAPVEEFTISLKNHGNATAQVTFVWGNESVSTTLSAG